MTGLPTWAEFTGLLALIGSAIGALWKRQENITTLKATNASLTSDLEKVKLEASRALKSHEDAMAAKKEELALYRETTARQIERLEDAIVRREARIERLEDELYLGRDRE